LAGSPFRSKSATALLRPIDEARRSAAALEASGYRIVLAPVTRIVGTGATVPDSQFDAIVATSARAFNFLSAEACARLAQIPMFAVGDSTAAAARSCGLSAVQTIAPDGSSLVPILLERLSSQTRLLYLAGQFRKTEIEDAVLATGAKLALVEVYRAEAAAGWSEAEADAIRGCAAALHYSPRSAVLACDFARQVAIDAHFREMTHVCLSLHVAEPLRALGASRIVIASRPREDALFAALQGAVQKV
jgi:uroporphyrinogen-III synthase